MDGSMLFLYVVILAVCGVAGAAIMSSKGRSPGLGFALGFLLGLIGILICVVTSKTTEKRVDEQLEFDAAMRRIHGLPPTDNEPPVDVPRTPRQRTRGGPPWQ